MDNHKDIFIAPCDHLGLMLLSGDPVYSMPSSTCLSSTPAVCCYGYSLTSAMRRTVGSVDWVKTARVFCLDYKSVFPLLAGILFYSDTCGNNVSRT